MADTPWGLIGGGVAGLAGSIIGSIQMGKQKRDDRERADKYWKEALGFERQQDATINAWDPTQGMYNVFGKLKGHDPFMQSLMQRNLDKTESNVLGMSKYQTGSGNRMGLIDAAFKQKRGGLDQMRQALGETRDKRRMLKLQGESDVMSKIAAGKSQKQLMKAQIMGERAAGRGSLSGAFEQSAREAAMAQAQIWGDFGTGTMKMAGTALGKDSGGDQSNTPDENEGMPSGLKAKKIFWDFSDIFRGPEKTTEKKWIRASENPGYDLYDLGL